MNLNLNALASSLITNKTSKGQYHFKVTQVNNLKVNISQIPNSKQHEASFTLRPRCKGSSNVLGTNVSNELLHAFRQTRVRKLKCVFKETAPGKFEIDFGSVPAKDDPCVSFDPHNKYPKNNFKKLFT